MNKVLNLDKAAFRMFFDKKLCVITVGSTERGTTRWSFQPLKIEGKKR